MWFAQAQGESLEVSYETIDRKAVESCPQQICPKKQYMQLVPLNKFIKMET